MKTFPAHYRRGTSFNNDSEKSKLVLGLDTFMFNLQVQNEDEVVMQNLCDVSVAIKIKSTILSHTKVDHANMDDDGLRQVYKFPFITQI